MHIIRAHVMLHVLGFRLVGDPTGALDGKFCDAYVETKHGIYQLKPYKLNIKRTAASVGLLANSGST